MFASVHLISLESRARDIEDSEVCHCDGCSIHAVIILEDRVFDGNISLLNGTQDCRLPIPLFKSTIADKNN